jgi:hypothetical protein
MSEEYDKQEDELIGRGFVKKHVHELKVGEEFAYVTTDPFLGEWDGSHWKLGAVARLEGEFGVSGYTVHHTNGETTEADECTEVWTRHPAVSFYGAAKCGICEETFPYSQDALMRTEVAEFVSPEGQHEIVHAECGLNKEGWVMA